jgi:hypothetical protein
MANDRLPDSLPHSSRRDVPDESTPDGPFPYETERTEIEAAARQLRARADFPAEYVDRVDDQAARFVLRTAPSGDIRAAIALLEEQTNVQALAPTESRNAAVGAAKKIVRKAVFFTVHHMTEQMRAFGWATTSVVTAAAERIEQLEVRVRELEARLEHVEPREGREDSSQS